MARVLFDCSAAPPVPPEVRQANALELIALCLVLAHEDRSQVNIVDYDDRQPLRKRATVLVREIVK